MKSKLISFFAFIFISNSTKLVRTDIITGDAFKSLAKYSLDDHSAFNPKEVVDGDIIFLKPDLLHKFYYEFLPKIKNKFILITHNSDLPVPGLFSVLLSDDRLIHWFGMNPTISNNSKFTAIPIGLANSEWFPEDKYRLFKKHAIGFSKKNKTRLLGINFRVGTNYDFRKEVYDIFIKKSFVYNAFDEKYENYLKKMQSCHFVLSPFGNGLDCHRTWEALSLGVIPIVLSSKLDDLFDCLPVLIVSSWDNVIPETLNMFLNTSRAINYNYEKTDFNYWENLIFSFKRQHED